MGFKLRNIDRAIEWALRDEVIARGFWPAERTFITNGDKAGFNAALAALQNKIDVFGVANFKDRSQLQTNNVIIDRGMPQIGDVSVAYPLYFELSSDSLSYNKYKSSTNTWHIEYEIRFVCDEIDLDRSIISIMNKVFPSRAFLYGMNDDMTNMTQGFHIGRVPVPVDLSDENYIEKVFRILVYDVDLEPEDGVNVPISTTKPVVEAELLLNPVKLGDDVSVPMESNDIATGAQGLGDFFLSLVETDTYFKKLKIARVYAQDTEVKALRNLIPVRSSAVNSGLTFVPYRGFRKTDVGQFLNVQFAPNLLGLTNYFYSVFVTTVPDPNLFELFGLVNVAASFYLKNDGTLKAKGNSDDELVLTTAIKPNTLYTLNRKNRFMMELWENDLMIGKLELQPTGIPSGNIKELNMNNQVDASIGTSVGGGIAASFAGEAFYGKEIHVFQQRVFSYMRKIGAVS